MIRFREQSWKIVSSTNSKWKSKRALFVECLNRTERRDRKKHPAKYNKWIPKTKYPEVGSNGNYGQKEDLVSKIEGLTTGMAVTWLGTSSGCPTLSRNVSSILLRIPEQTLVFDAGEGTQMQFIRAKIFPSSIKKIFVTHLHGDHCFGLPGLLSLINEAKLFHDQGDRMYVYGPPGLGELMKMALPHWFDRFRMNLTIVEFNSDPKASTEPRSIDPNNRVLIQQMPPTATIELPSQDVFAEGFEFRQGSTVENYKWEIDGGEGMTVTACQLQHRVPCWGYVVQEADYRPNQWELDLWKKQQEGNPNVVIDDVSAWNALAYPGRKIVILGDTCNSDMILTTGKNADLLSHEATFSGKMWRKALKAQHSTATMAGEFARRLNAKRLVLTHFSPRYSSICEDLNESANERDIKMLISEAKRALGSENVLAASDFMTLDIPINRSSNALLSLK